MSSLRVLNFAYLHADKLLYLAAGAAGVYYSVAAANQIFGVGRELLFCYRSFKSNCSEAANYVQRFSDYFSGTFRCGICGKTCRHARSFDRHLDRWVEKLHRSGLM
jgi:hypothetical protein